MFFLAIRRKCYLFRNLGNGHSFVLFGFVFIMSCSKGKIIENNGKCPNIQNTSQSIRSYSIVHEYSKSNSKSDILTLKPGETVLLDCNGSIKSTIAGSVKIKQNNYQEHKCADSYNRPRNCDGENSGRRVRPLRQ